MMTNQRSERHDRRGHMRHTGDSRLEKNAESPWLRLVSRLTSALFGVVGVPLAAFFGLQLYEVVMEQMKTNTLVLHQNQLAFEEISRTQSVMGAAIGRNTKDILENNNGRRRMWRLYGEVEKRLVRLETIHEMSGE